MVMGLEQILFGQPLGVLESPHLANFEMQQFGEGLGALQRQHLQDMRAQVIALLLPFVSQRAHARSDRGRQHANVVDASR